jgi:MYXO-CTERM domain-containing protein
VLHFLVKDGSGGGTLAFGTATRLNDGAVPVVTQDGAVTAGAARLEVSPNPAGGYDFGAHAPGETAEAVFTVTNTGTAALQGGAYASGPAFTVTQGQSFNLNPGQSAEVRVRFAPAAEGVHTGTLTLTGDPRGSVAIALQGEGVKRKVFGCSGGGAGGPENRGDLAVIGLTAVLLGLFARRRRRA